MFYTNPAFWWNEIFKKYVMIHKKIVYNYFELSFLLKKILVHGKKMQLIKIWKFDKWKSKNEFHHIKPLEWLKLLEETEKFSLKFYECSHATEYSTFFHAVIAKVGCEPLIPKKKVEVWSAKDFCLRSAVAMTINLKTTKYLQNNAAILLAEQFTSVKC